LRQPEWKSQYSPTSSFDASRASYADELRRAFQWGGRVPAKFQFATAEGGGFWLRLCSSIEHCLPAGRAVGRDPVPGRTRARNRWYGTWLLTQALAVLELGVHLEPNFAVYGTLAR
jgi:hypothetical protein